MVLYVMAEYLPEEVKKKGKSKAVPASMNLVIRFAELKHLMKEAVSACLKSERQDLQAGVCNNATHKLCT